ncbi:putative phospholipid-transporting ATPase IH [Collichthys lucidus]|uniref:Putative phospholipid-transporting ATPase IH n=1 Tax=Collichthys lucidus TaxID=240159 RepID=A0A4V6AM26_COLLU|nr:putative phospholipid-transporting ATPase IH [Collichthys lucidus]
MIDGDCVGEEIWVDSRTVYIGHKEPPPGAEAYIPQRYPDNRIVSSKSLLVDRKLLEANGAPAGAVAGEIREKGPARVQSRRRRPPYPVPSAGPPSARRRTPPREAPRGPRGPARRAARRAFGGGERRATAPPAAARAQPRFAPQPDRPSP